MASAWVARNDRICSPKGSVIKSKIAFWSATPWDGLGRTSKERLGLLMVAVKISGSLMRSTAMISSLTATRHDDMIMLG